MDHATDPLQKMSALVVSNMRSMSVLGASAMVFGKFLDTTIPHLTAPQRARIADEFRDAVEDEMSLMDDLPLPAEYHSTLLELTNAVLGALEPAPSGHRDIEPITPKKSLSTGQKLWRFLLNASHLNEGHSSTQQLSNIPADHPERV